MPTQCNRLYNLYVTSLGLAVLLLLLNGGRALKCKPLDEYTEEEQDKINVFFEMRDNEELGRVVDEESYLEEIQYTEDNTKVLIVQEIHKSNNGEIYELEMDKKFSDISKDAGFRVGLEVDDIFCVKNDDEEILMYLEEKYSNNFKLPEMDEEFFQSMKKLITRMRFYLQTLKVYCQVPAHGYRHCDIRPGRFVFKQNDESTAEETSLPFFPMMRDFGSVRTFENFCRGRLPEYSDPEVFTRTINKTEAFNANMELFSVALLLLHFEVKMLQAQARNIENQDALIESFSELPEASDHMKKYTRKETPVDHITSLTFISNQLREMLGDWNKEKLDLGYSAFVNEVDYVEKAMVLYYQFILQNTLEEEAKEKIPDIVKAYQAYLDLLKKMMKENSSIPPYRPGCDTAIGELNGYIEALASVDEENNRRARRIILV